MSGHNGFKHSAKVPRLYKVAATIAKQVSEQGGNIKSIVYEYKHYNTKALYALVVETFQHADDLNTILKKSKFLEKEPRVDLWLAKILITELLWGKQHLSQILTDAKPIKTILAYEQIFKAHISDSASNQRQIEEVLKPRYVRVNTILISPQEVIDGFRDEGWIFSRFMGKSYTEFLEGVASLGPSEFTVDFHIPYLLIFPPKTLFYNHPAYKSGEIILQDKASCLPVFILGPEPGSTVLDMCAAPGMKTTQISALLQNEGKIYAVEKDQKRFGILNKLIADASATCIETINRDVLTLNEDTFPKVDYILVDPSCSGSGMTSRFNPTQISEPVDENRISNLVGFQKKILRHALKHFSHAKRVVYSTCSDNSEENENVVRQVLETSTSFKLVPAKKVVKNGWINFGSADFGEIGARCLYAKREVDLTDGFFIAVFERLGEGEHNEFLNKELFKLQKKEKKENEKRLKNMERLGGEIGYENYGENQEDSVENSEMRQNYNDTTAMETRKKSSKKNKRKSTVAETHSLNGYGGNVETSIEKKKENHDVRKEESFAGEQQISTDDTQTKEQTENRVEAISKKKRKRKGSDGDSGEADSVNGLLEMKVDHGNVETIIKKRKKNRDVNNQESFAGKMEITTDKSQKEEQTVNCVETNCKKKRKKKGGDGDHEETDRSSGLLETKIDDGNVETVIKKKKKKHDSRKQSLVGEMDETQTEEQAENCVETITKKKRKKKRDESDSPENISIKNQLEDNEAAQDKIKKKNKKSSNAEEINTSGQEKNREADSENLRAIFNGSPTTQLQEKDPTEHLSELEMNLNQYLNNKDEKNYEKRKKQSNETDGSGAHSEELME